MGDIAKSAGIWGHEMERYVLAGVCMMSVITLFFICSSQKLLVKKKKYTVHTYATYWLPKAFSVEKNGTDFCCSFKLFPFFCSSSTLTFK